MFKYWQQCELHVEGVAIGVCVPQTSGLRKGEGNSVIIIMETCTYPIIVKLTSHFRVKVMYIYLHNYSNEGNPFICCLCTESWLMGLLAVPCH